MWLAETVSIVVPIIGVGFFLRDNEAAELWSFASFTGYQAH